MNVPLLIIGGISLLAGVGLLVARRSGAAWAALGLAALLLLGAFVFPQVSREQEDLPTVAFVRPAAGTQVSPGALEVQVRVSNGSLAESPTDEGGHLHLYVDDHLVQMPYTDTTTINLPSGQHRLRVEYVDSRHVSYTPPIEDRVEVRVG